MRITYKTRLDEHPSGKQNIYFTCYPGDFERFFENISSSILKTHDVAIWYKVDSCDSFKSEDDMYELLGQMQFFVIPITSWLLRDEKTIIKDEVAFAKDNNIPILALMMEEGIDNEFSKEFNDIQYLKPISNDPMEIAYEKKLKRFLDSVIISEENIKRVKSNFDAYIFLSYRKKDRKSALELMQLIHKIPEYVNVAIWYDEYLIPGENFRHAIEKAISESEIFAMLVTPNLVNEENYVKNDEFPMALLEQQPYPIIPIEMEKTDRTELEKQFPGIPAILEGKWNTVFVNKMKEILEDIAFNKYEDSVEQTFLTGLAYLNGIDVEVNYICAVELITKAAEANLPEAMSQLATMFYNGIGVNRDYNKAISWREKCVKAYNDINNKELLYEELIKLSEECFFIGRLEKAKKYYLEIVNLLETVIKEDNVIIKDLGTTFERLGEVERLSGRLEEANYWFEKCVACCKNQKEMKHVLLTVFEKQGIIARKQGDLKTADEKYKKAIELINELDTGTNKGFYKFALSNLYDRRGEIAKLKGIFSDAERWYKLSLLIRLELLKNCNEVKFINAICSSYIHLGDIALSQKKNCEALDLYEEGKKQLDTIPEETDDVSCKNNRLILYERFAAIDEEKGNYEKSKDWYGKSFELIEELLSYSESIELLETCALLYYRLGNLEKAYNSLEEARECYIKALKLFARINESIDSIQTELRLADGLEQLGYIYLAWEDYNIAKDYFIRAKNNYIVIESNCYQYIQGINVLNQKNIYYTSCAKHCRKKVKELNKKIKRM